MTDHRGYLWEIEGGGKAASYHKEQRTQFEAVGKIFIHYLDTNLEPILNERGEPKTGLKAKEKLFLIGYTD